MSTPRLVNLPPSDPVTPSDMGPSTPNSGTTSLSGISTTAIKDGHQGNVRPHAKRAHRSSSASDNSTTTLDAERADRISRLAGLERVATERPDSGASLNPHSTNLHPSSGYFDPANSHLQKERSTVGSASATGSIGGRTTWASGSDIFDDKMGDDHDDGTSSMGGFSDENASLVGFGEGANSTTSGPVSTAPTRMTTILSRQASATASSPSANRSSSHSVPSNVPHASPLELDPTMPSPTESNTPEPIGISTTPGDARMVDGMTFDTNVVDTTDRPAPPVSLSQTSSGADAASIGRIDNSTEPVPNPK